MSALGGNSPSADTDKSNNLVGPPGADSTVPGPEGPVSTVPGPAGADGVVATIVGGANITVDATDPANPIAKLDLAATAIITASWTFTQTLNLSDELFAFSGGNNRFLFGSNGATGNYGGLEWNDTTKVLALSNTAYVNNLALEVLANGDIACKENVTSAIAPTSANHLTRKDFVEGRTNKIDISAFIQGAPTDAEKLATFVATRAFTLPSGLTASQGFAEVVSTAAATIDVQVNAVSKGTINFATATAAATFTFASPVVIAAGDRIQFIAQGTADATLADISFTIRGDI